MSNELLTTIQETVNSSAFGIWLLIGVAMVFFMHCGFTMIESGFTRAKNAGNIIMKTLVDFCIGALCFTLLGFGLMMSENYFFGFIGAPNYQLFSDFGGFINGNASTFVINLVFCATTATIVSGSMAERTKFSSYCVYSAIMSLVVYPIEAGWIWNPNGWLAQLGFHDFAGSAAIHAAGGMAAFIGAIVVGPRLGKYIKDKNGKVTKVNAIQGHSLTLGALGCFILWFGWYGFNGAAAWDITSLGSIFLTTTLAPAAATIACLIFTWVKNGKPDVSMCINASLAGLVGVTAGCDAVNAVGAMAIGVVSGIIVVVAVEVIDIKLHVDDPAGASAVHLVNGTWGTIAVGLFADPQAPAGLSGLFYTGSGRLLGVQLLGIVCVLAWTAVCMVVAFSLIKKVMGIRVSADEEIKGLDISEHGLLSAYADFAPKVSAIDYGYENAELVTGDVPMAEAVEVKKMPSFDDGTPKITKVEIICRESKFETFKAAMTALGVKGMTVSHVLGCGTQKGKPEYYRGVEVDTTLLPKIQIDIVVKGGQVGRIIDVAKKALYTGHIGDGKIFVYDVEDVVRVRTGETGVDALMSEE